MYNKSLQLHQIILIDNLLVVLRLTQNVFYIRKLQKWVNTMNKW